jgi:hypothetical protein
MKLKTFRGVAAMVVLMGSVAAGRAGGRMVVSLDGTWDIAEGNMESIPARFGHRVTVPGLASLAVPAFTDPPGPRVADRSQFPQKDSKRSAFWYRRSFRLDQAAPTVALLKVHKTMFGTRVMLNGQALGDHLPSFTPGYFNAKPALRTGENELLIRVGADRDAVGPAIPAGFDFEKERYIPGIFDSVELILSGTPHLAQVQTAPDITNKTVRIQALLRNDGEPVEGAVTFVVREAKSGREVGRLMAESVSLGKGAEKIVEVRIPIADCRLWSPEDPFLYELETATGGDSVRTRFGMREFRLDHATSRAVLNGRPYYLRGSNVTLYRFFEDALCGTHPWDEAWVRRLHRAFKGMHWNSLRYCIGFPPELWYRIADEEGVLIQDEFPIWHGPNKWPPELRSEELIREYSEWMQERWNHPCVVIWDAQNETATRETGKAIRAVRGLDLSNRPWDNGYSEAGSPDDVFESHPYLSNNPNFILEDLKEVSGVPQGNYRANTGHNPILINEYGWLWLNRDGSPTTLTEKVYANLLGTNATPAQRRHLYARYLAAKTEFWRSHRACAGVLHFCGLGYSRADGQTCDNFIDLDKLRFDPEFKQYVGDAFAPVGLMIDEWSEQLLAGQKHSFRVVVINDLCQTWKGRVRFRVLLGSKVVHEQSRSCQVAAGGKTELQFVSALPVQPGRYRFEGALVQGFAKPVRSIREIELTSTLVKPGDSLALRKPVRASSFHQEAGADYRPENAVDGAKRTRWSSEFKDKQWLAVDLRRAETISRVKLLWETACARSYAIQVSNDGREWKDVYTVTDSKGGTEELRFAPVTARWVRVYCRQRATEWGNSIWEFQVFEK